MNIDPRLKPIADAHPYPLLFATISGAHLYGFPSPDSDYDLRGVHILPAREVLGIKHTHDTIERAHAPQTPDDIDLDLVTHDLAKFIRLMLKRNGYVLEQLYSPLIITTCCEHDELKALGRGCITKHHVHHYIGFARNQWDLFAKESPPRVKPLLYVYRVLLTGIHLMRSGEIEANLVTLNASMHLPYLPDLIARKTAGPEQARLTDADVQFHRGEFERLIAQLDDAGRATHLPDMPTTRDALNDLLVCVRLRTIG